jgi:hypothetical protein
MKTPEGITPPSPHPEREEPELRREDDIPADDGGPSSADERSNGESSGRLLEEAREERPLRKVERE